ncbi:MAG: 50S ribosomal protein L3 [Acidobacteria bacterium]|nr:50S ribosomal protein L3 [Acidobacteriota bacterium]
MVEGLIGKKIGMTQLFREDGSVVPATVIQAGPCVVVQRKTLKNDGYNAVQLGFVEGKPARKVTKPREGHFKKAGVLPTRILREFKVEEGDDLKVGDQLLVDALFKERERVNVVGTSKGRGFAGVVKRHHFRGGAATHGSMFHRAPGSIGASSFPSRVWPGQRMAGRMGNERVTARNLQVVRVNGEQNVLVVRGSVPGANGSYLLILKPKTRNSKPET